MSSARSRSKATSKEYAENAGLPAASSASKREKEMNSPLRSSASRREKEMNSPLRMASVVRLDSPSAVPAANPSGEAFATGVG